MSDVLEKIINYKRQEIVAAKSTLSLPELEILAGNAPSVRDFTEALRHKTENGSYALIAEIKKASPSKGLIRADFDPEALAKAYAAGGAACLSVLTDMPSFQGRPEFLTAVRNIVQLPVLRKDFMLEPYQIVQARAWGADCILVILAAIDDDEAKVLIETAKTWNMDVLAEVHNEAELDRALKLDTPLIGINNRNLKTFETTLETTEQLAPLIPKDKIIIAESGIFSNKDLDRLSQVGAQCFLVGESLMRQDDVEAATRALLSHAPATQ